MIRYPLSDGETLWSAVIHAGMMAHAEAQGGAKNIGYVIVCNKCGEAIDDHKHPEDCRIFQEIYR